MEVLLALTGKIAHVRAAGTYDVMVMLGLHVEGVKATYNGEGSVVSAATELLTLLTGLNHMMWAAVM